MSTAKSMTQPTQPDSRLINAQRTANRPRFGGGGSGRSVITSSICSHHHAVSRSPSSRGSDLADHLIHTTLPEDIVQNDHGQLLPLSATSILFPSSPCLSVYHFIFICLSVFRNFPSFHCMPLQKSPPLLCPDSTAEAIPKHCRFNGVLPNMSCWTANGDGRKDRQSSFISSALRNPPVDIRDWTCARPELPTFHGQPPNHGGS